MKKSVLLLFFFVLTLIFHVTTLWSESLSVPVQEIPINETVSGGEVSGKNTVNKNEEAEQAESEATPIKDPLQPFNRAMFTFNDKFYHYVFKPTYKGYEKVIPEKARVSVGKCFSNLRMPSRFFNCLLQGKFKGAGIEISRFIVNITAGVGGFFDPAKSLLHLEKQDKDFGQTLGKRGMGTGAFIVWPFLGPSNLRDTLGFIGDTALDPLFVASFFTYPLATGGAEVYDRINDASTGKGEVYESITKPAVDPYIAVQDAYINNRMKKIKE